MTARHSLDQIVRGLDGVTGGKWCQFHPDYCAEANSAPFMSWDTSHDVSAIIDGERVKLATFKHADDAAHMDRCSPDAMREIAAYVRELERDRQDRIAQCDRMANDWSEFCEIIGVTWDTQEAVAAELEARATAAEARIRDLEERLAKAAEALERIATAAERIDTYYAEETGNQTPLDNGVIISTLIIGDELSLFLLGDLRRARTALSQIRSEK